MELAILKTVWDQENFCSHSGHAEKYLISNVCTNNVLNASLTKLAQKTDFDDFNA